MALHTLTDDGRMGWTCHECTGERTAHISHEQVEHPVQGNNIDRSIVALPPCECGTRTFLKVAFTDKELAAPNMMEPVTNDMGEVIGRLPTASLAIAHRHMELARQMQAAGKAQLPPVQAKQEGGEQ